LQTFKEVERFNSGNIGGIKCLTLTNDDKQIISGGGDKIVRIFNSSNFKIVAELSGHTDFVSCLSVSNDGKLLASGGWDGQIFIYSLVVNEIIYDIQAFSKEGGIHTLSFSIDGKYLLAGSSGRKNYNLKCWE
jgi:WD40 repeat protein